MLSDACLIDEFAEKIKDMSYEEIICRADQEATEAERRFYRTRLQPSAQTEQLKNYAAALKDILIYMRHGVRSSAIRQVGLGELEGIRCQRLGIESDTRIH